MKIQKTIITVLIIFLIGCGETTFYTGPSVEIKEIGKVYVNINTNNEIVVGGELRALNKTSKKWGNIGWDVGFEYTFNEARSESNTLYILWDDSFNVIQETYSFAQPFEVEFAQDEWVGRIANTGDNNVIVYVDKSVLHTDSPQATDGVYARISSQVEEANLRKSPGYIEKNDATDVIIAIPSSAIVEIFGGPQNSDGLSWWYVSWNGYEGWLAESTGSGRNILIFNP